MPISAETLSALQQLMAQNKELLAQVQTTTNAVQAATLIARAAKKNGIDVQEAELADHLDSASKSVTAQALSDQQLETVAGGIDADGGMALISVFTFGIGCATISIWQAAAGNKPNSRSWFFEKKFC